MLHKNYKHKLVIHKAGVSQMFHYRSSKNHTLAHRMAQLYAFMRMSPISTQDWGLVGYLGKIVTMME